MASRYHINPVSGEAGLCMAQRGNCPFGKEEAHYPSAEAARRAYEAYMERHIPLQPHENLVEVKSLRPNNVKYLFLEVDGVTVSALKADYREGTPVVYNVETHPDHRRKGHAKRLLDLTAQSYGVDRMDHRGGFTADGIHLSSYLNRPDEYGPARIDYPEYNEANPFSFVADWEGHRLRWP